MTAPIFHLDDEVEIIGTSKRFKISEIIKGSDGVILYSTIGVQYHPASSLRLVEEELKIGDLVKVIGQPKGNSFEPVGKIALIQKTEFYTNGGSGFCVEGYWYPRESLRKLAPEEIKQHTDKTNTFTVKFKCDTSEVESELDKAADKCWKIGIEARLSAIKNQQADYDCALLTMGQTIGKMQDQIDQMKRAFWDAGK